MTTLTIMRVLPREVDPLVYNMAAEDPGKVSVVKHDSSTCRKQKRDVLSLDPRAGILLRYWRSRGSDPSNS
jgi:hypothetical protein